VFGISLNEFDIEHLRYKLKSAYGESILNSTENTATQIGIYLERCEATIFIRTNLYTYLRDGGAPVCKLSKLFCLLIVNRISYCVSACMGGFLNAEPVGRIMPYLNVLEDTVLQNILLIFVVLLIKHGYCELRNRGHNFVLPPCNYISHVQKSFIYTKIAVQVSVNAS
jgi:hypothetical protein